MEQRLGSGSWIEAVAEDVYGQGIAAGTICGGGAKFAGESSGGAYVEVDQELGDELPEADVEQLLSGRGVGGGDEVDVPVTG